MTAETKTEKTFTWYLSRITFTLILNSSALGIFHTWEWYEAQKVQTLDVTQLENEALSQLSKEISSEIKFRNGK